MPSPPKLVSLHAGPQHGGGAREGEASDWPRLSQVTTLGPISYSRGRRLARGTSVTWHVGHMARLGRGEVWGVPGARPQQRGWVGSGTEPARPAVRRPAIQKMPGDKRLRQRSGRDGRRAGFIPCNRTDAAEGPRWWTGRPLARSPPTAGSYGGGASGWLAPSLSHRAARPCPQGPPPALTQGSRVPQGGLGGSSSPGPGQRRSAERPAENRQARASPTGTPWY